MITSIAWAFDDDQVQSKLKKKLSQSNIILNKDDRIRFVPDNFYSVDFVDKSHGWAAGYYGTILKTIDGGETWTHISLPNTDLIRRIQFLDRNYGWLVTHRGRIMSSEDGGITWKTRYLEDKQINLRNIKFINHNIGWAIGHEGIILHTKDGGKTWINQSLNNFTGRDLPRLNGLVVLSETRAILAGEFGIISETIDAGKTWTIISSPDIETTFTEIEQVGNSIFAVGLNGVIVQIKSNKIDMFTLTEGEKYFRIEPLDSGVNKHFFDIVSNKSGEGIIVGLANILMIKDGSELSKIEINLRDHDYLYFMGATYVSKSQYVLVGARGLVVNLDTETSEISGLVKW
jgi:hypothetical protein